MGLSIEDFVLAATEPGLQQVVHKSMAMFLSKIAQIVFQVPSRPFPKENGHSSFVLFR